MMWRSILDISKFVFGDGVFLANMKSELANRQSFHVFEMMPVQGRVATLELYFQYKILGLSYYWLPFISTLTILVLGKRASIIFTVARNTQLWIEKNLKLKL